VLKRSCCVSVNGVDGVYCVCALWDRSGRLHRAQKHVAGTWQVPVRTQRKQGRRSADSRRSDGRSGQAQPTAGGTQCRDEGRCARSNRGHQPWRRLRRTEMTDQLPVVYMFTSLLVHHSFFQALFLSTVTDSRCMRHRSATSVIDCVTFDLL